MAQSFETPNGHHEKPSVDAQQVYCTNAIIVRVGRAAAVSLEDAMLPGNAKHKHMTIMFRPRPRWSDDEIALIAKEADQWILAKYGDNKAPITFTISNWGPHSVLINGDLNELCMHLRKKFAAFIQNEQRPQRPAHVSLFANHGKNGKNGKRVRNGKHAKNGKNKKHRYKSPKGGKGNNQEKGKQRLETIISKMEQLKNKKRSELNLLDDQQQRLMLLLSNADDMDCKTLRDEIKKIEREFKNKRKFMNDADKQRKRDRKFQKRQSKVSKKGRKKGSNHGGKMQKKLEREERKRLRQEKVERLSAARIESLPIYINASVLNIYVDGYNIIGCDSICRKSMRGRGGGMKRSRRRMARLLQENFLNELKNMNLAYNVVLKLWFDGNGKNEKYGDIDITFSSKKQIVDDKLVEMFSKCTKKENENKLVITSDRELTLRLNDIGVKVMKSSTFYKKYLKDNHNEVSGVDNDNDDNNMEVDDEKEITVDDNDNEEDNFVTIMAKKLNFGDSSDAEVSEGNVDGEDDDTAPDQIEGEFTYVFGEDSEEYEDMDSNPTDEMDMD